MAKDKITEYDATANNNTVCGDVNIAENSALPSDMNNFAREIMSHLKEGLGSGTPLYVDQTNNRVGINKTPTVALDVSGDADLSGTLDVTGAVTAGGLTVEGSVGNSSLEASGAELRFTRSGLNNINCTGASGRLETYTGGSVLRHKIDSNGDISFYEDTGTTAKFFWDSSEERLGIGTSSPSVELSIAGSDPQLVLWEGTDGASSSKVQLGTGTSQGFVNIHKGDGTRTVQLNSDGDTYLNGGNVGIGTSSPYKSLTVGDSDETAYISAGGNNVNLSIASIGSSGSVIFKTGGTNGNATTTTERMRVRYDGKVGIGITNPEGALHIDLSGNGSEAGPHLQIGNSVGYSGYHWLDSTAYYIGQDSAIRQLRLYSGAETAGVVMGNGATSWSSYSDERLKKDIEPISNGLQKLADLRCVSYRLKDVDAEDSQKKLGIIAQDLVNKVDEVINLTKRKDDETEYMSVRYTEMIPVLIKAIQELKAELDSAKARITALENGE